MLSADNERRRKAAFAIEQQIDARLELLQIPLTPHSCCVDQNGSYRGFELIYQKSNGERLAVEFTSEELDRFAEDPLPETLGKIEYVATHLRNQRLRQEQ